MLVCVSLCQYMVTILKRLFSFDKKLPTIIEESTDTTTKDTIIKSNEKINNVVNIINNSNSSDDPDDVKIISVKYKTKPKNKFIKIKKNSVGPIESVILTNVVYDKTKDILYWNDISKNDILDESYISKYADKLNWRLICQYQKLSIEFMTTFSHKLHWKNVTYYQNLTDDFVLKFFNKIDWSVYSYLYRNKNHLIEKYIIKENNWLYKSRNDKRKMLQSYYKTVIIGSIEYVECYKVVNHDYKSLYAPDLFKYEINKKYKTMCDFNELNTNSKGFGCWNFKNAEKIFIRLKNNNNRILKCLIPIDDVCMQKNGKLRGAVLYVICEV